LRASKKARKDDWGEVAIEAWEGFWFVVRGSLQCWGRRERERD
jgi:hypothetical protein